MRKLYCWLTSLGVAWLSTTGLATAQMLPYPGPRSCATQAADNLHQGQLQRAIPGYRPAKATSPPGVRPRGTTATTYTLPVVVHVIYDGEAVGTGTNLSQAQIQSQIDVLNEDYRNLNADGTQVPSVFQPLRGDMQFQFRLALRDPGGNLLAEPGIDRVDRHARGWDAPPYGRPVAGGSLDLTYIENTIKPQTYWNPEQYVNLWVMSIGGNVLGYAQYPDNTAGLMGLSPLGGQAATDGVVVQYAAFGRTGTLTTNYDRGRTLTHELGHWLGLLHTWGDSNCGDDYVADTPTQQTSNFGCPAFPHVTCSNGPNGDLFMDYMDYSDDACMHLFTPNQKDRMQAVMAANTPRRTILLTSPALCQSFLAATAANSGPVCAGSSATLRATGPAGATYAWSGPAGYSSTQQNPVLPAANLTQAGTYTVQVSLPGNNCPGIATTALVVTPAPPAPLLTATGLLVCAGTPVMLATTNYPAAAPPGTTYTWSLVRGDGLPAAVSSPTLTVVPKQSSTYRLTVSTPTCSASDTVRILIRSLTWTGAAGNADWFDARNWDGCGVPTRYIDAFIPAGLSTPYPIISSGNAEVHDLSQQGDLLITGGELALYGGHVANNRPAWLVPGGTVALRGTGYQVLRGGTYARLLIAGPGTKLVTAGTISITEALVMQRGISLFDATLSPTATITESDSSYVIGRVQTTRTVGTTPTDFGGLGLTLTASSPPGTTTLTRNTGGAPYGLTGLPTVMRTYQLAAANGSSIPGATLRFGYLPHEAKGIDRSGLAAFHSPDQGFHWTNEGAGEHDDTAPSVTRRYVPTLTGTWALGINSSPPSPLTAAFQLAAFPVPFSSDGLAVLVNTATAGPLTAKLYNVLGQVVYDQTMPAVEVGSSTFYLTGTGQLQPGRYVLFLEQGYQHLRLQVVKE